METNRDNLWVDDRLAALEPQWRPDAARARAALDARLTERRRPWTWAATAATAAAMFIAVLAIPATRAIAQELWDRFVLNRVDIVRVDLSRLPLNMHVTTNGLERSVKDVDEAEQRAGFRPYLPVSEGAPALTVLGPMELEQTIRIHDLEAALGERVPAEWEGVQLRTEIGPLVSAKYPDDVSILQSRPAVFSVPSGFALERFTEAAFRSIGVSSWEARALSQRFAAHPSWLLDIPADKVVNIEEMRLSNGPALLIEEFDEKGVFEKVTILRSTGERMYSVSAGSRERTQRIAESLP